MFGPVKRPKEGPLKTECSISMLSDPEEEPAVLPPMRPAASEFVLLPDAYILLILMMATEESHPPTQPDAKSPRISLLCRYLKHERFPRSIGNTSNAKYDKRRWDGKAIPRKQIFLCNACRE